MVVHGRVQGVGFRYFVRQHARDRGITGWVKNLPGRDVEIHAEGEKADVDEFIDRVKEGPSFSHVTDVDIDWLEPSDQYSSFDIRF
jgi:acylphosphatase